MAADEFGRLVTALEDLIATGPRMPVTELALVREQELVDVLARLRGAVPASAVRAEQQRAEIEGIHARANDAAEDLLQRAQDEVERLVHDPHLQRDARKRADEALSEARIKAESVRASADAFLSSSLSTFAEHLNDLETVLLRDIENLRQGTQALGERTAAARLSHDVPLEPERPLLAPGPVQSEYHGVPGGTSASPDPRSGPNAPTPDSPLR